MTRDQIEMRLRGTYSWDIAAEDTRRPFVEAVQQLEPTGFVLEYIWRFYCLGFLKGSGL